MPFVLRIPLFCRVTLSTPLANVFSVVEGKEPKAGALSALFTVHRFPLFTWHFFFFLLMYVSLCWSRCSVGLYIQHLLYIFLFLLLRKLLVLGFPDHLGGKPRRGGFCVFIREIAGCFFVYPAAFLFFFLFISFWIVVIGGREGRLGKKKWMQNGLASLSVGIWKWAFDGWFDIRVERECAAQRLLFFLLFFFVLKNRARLTAIRSSIHTVSSRTYTCP